MEGIGVRAKIWEELSKRGRMTHDEVIEFARKDRHYKESQLERRMRPSESPLVKTIYKDGSAVAYEWIGLTPYKAESMDDKRKREIREKEDAILAAYKSGRAISY